MAKADIRAGVSGSPLSATFYISAKNAKNRWLWCDGVLSNKLGYILLTDVTLDSITVTTPDTSTANFKVYKNGAEIASVDLVADTFEVFAGLALSLVAQDELAIYMSNSAGVSYPKVFLGFL